MTQRVPCKKCGAEILPATANATGGVCMACKSGIRKDIEKSKECHAKERQKEAAYAPFRKSNLVRSQPIRRPADLRGLVPIPLPMMPGHGLGPFLLGTPRGRIREVMAEVGLPLESEKPTMDYCCASALQFEYGDTGCVQFIGVAYDARLDVTWKDRSVFGMNARELFDLLNADEPCPLEYNDYDPRFPSQGVRLWDPQKQYDYLEEQTRPVWAQIARVTQGVGSP